MKISKNASKCLETTSDINDMTDQDKCIVYQSAQKSIKCAIDTLGKYAAKSGDSKSKEVIANLSVLLFDLDRTTN